MTYHLIYLSNSMQIFWVAAQHFCSLGCATRTSGWNDKIPSCPMIQYYRAALMLKRSSAKAWQFDAESLLLKMGTGEWVSSVNRFVKWRRRLYSQCGNWHIAQHTSNKQSVESAKEGYFCGFSYRIECFPDRLIRKGFEVPYECMLSDLGWYTDIFLTF